MAWRKLEHAYTADQKLGKLSLTLTSPNRNPNPNNTLTLTYLDLGHAPRAMHRVPWAAGPGFSKTPMQLRVLKDRPFIYNLLYCT